MKVTEQLPLVSQPRIVKLHGSFDSTFPLIFAEEDYRTYPDEYAPFVNTVQQALMETVFLLIGFSGDDPNFLNWSGWVRDNLSDAAPKIYLAGWLDLSPHRRRMLEDRGVVSIDLARHPKATNWSDHLRHEYATEWILQALERGQPYDQRSWPSPPDSRNIVSVPPDLEPMPSAFTGVPKADLDRSYKDNDPFAESEPLDRVKGIVAIWAYNRNLYPGWLIFPTSKERSDFRRNTDDWEPPILNGISELSPVERIFALRELVWRREVLGEPIYTTFEDAAQPVLDDINCLDRTVSGVQETRDDWQDIQEAWSTVACSLITAARLDCKPELFEKRLASVRSFAVGDPAIAQRLHHETCLMHLFSMDFDALNNYLDSWDVANQDPLWVLRKAALLTEIGRTQESGPLIQGALNSIRRNRSSISDIASSSREGWALGSTVSWENRDEVFRTWEELAPQRSDAWSELEQVERAVRGTEKREDPPPFNNIVGTTIGETISNADHYRMIAAYRAVRLPEVAGLPPVNVATSHPLMRTSAASGVLATAAEELIYSNAELAIRLVLRICNSHSDKTLQRVLSRIHLATLSDEVATKLAELCFNVIRWYSQRLFDRTLPASGSTLVGRAEAAMEVLRRLVLRAEPKTVEAALDVALEMFQIHGVAGHPLMARPLFDLFQAVWHALPPDRRSQRALDLLGAPLPGLGGFPPEPECSDPALVVRKHDLQLVTATDRSKCRTVVDFLIGGLNGSGATRQWAISRLLVLVHAEAITDDENKLIAEALWRDSDPVETNTSGKHAVMDWVYLELPELQPAQAEESFRRKWLSPRLDNEDNDSGFCTNMLDQVGAALAAFQALNRTFLFTPEDEIHAAKCIERFVASFAQRSVTFNFVGIGQTIHHIGLIATHVTLPEKIADNLKHLVEIFLGQQRSADDQFLKPLIDARVAIGFALIPGLIRANPNVVDQLVAWLSSGLVLDVGSRVMGAKSAIQSWISASSNGAVEPVPDDLILEVGTIVTTGRGSKLGAALMCGVDVFDHGHENQRDQIAPSAIRGLNRLSDLLTYDSARDSETERVVHTLRLLCVQLAIAMAKRDHESHEIIASWLDIGRQDPYPETRNEVFDFDQNR